MSSLRPASLRATLRLALATTALAALGCGDEGVAPDYIVDEGAAGAAAVYRPLRPNVTPGAAGTYGIDRAPGLNTGGAPSYVPGSAGSDGLAGTAGTFGRGSAGTSGTDLYFGSAGTSGSSGF